MADKDADGDGIPDALEFGLSGRDYDGDGIDDSLDATPQGGANGPSPGIRTAMVAWTTQCFATRRRWPGRLSRRRQR